MQSGAPQILGRLHQQYRPVQEHKHKEQDGEYGAGHLVDLSPHDLLHAGIRIRPRHGK